MKKEWFLLAAAGLCLNALPSLAWADEPAQPEEEDGIVLTKEPPRPLIEQLDTEKLETDIFEVSLMRGTKDHVRFGRHGDRNRGFVASNEGVFMIMVSNPVDDPTQTVSGSLGSRTFMFFPIRQTPAGMGENDRFLTIGLPMGGQMVVDKATGTFKDLSRAEFMENPKILKIKKSCNEKKEPGSCGGFEITKAKFGLVLDLGWTAGGSTLGHKYSNSQSTLIDTAGKRCTVKNTELFDYSKDKDNPALKHSEETLVKFLAKKCPKLKTSDLTKPLPPAVATIYEEIPADEEAPKNEEPLEVDAISGADPAAVPKPKPNDGPVTSPSEVPDSGPKNTPQGPVTSPAEVEDKPVEGPITHPSQVPDEAPKAEKAPAQPSEPEQQDTDEKLQPSPSGLEGPINPYPEEDDETEKRTTPNLYR